MRRVLLFLALSLPYQVLAANLELREVPAEVYFSPHGEATDALVRHIDAAHDSILLLAYSFTSSPIAEALCRAVARGVRVEAVLDRSQRTARGSQGQLLATCGGTVFVDDKHAIAHNKVMIFDGETLSTGSFNFTSSAEDRNAENLLILRSPDLSSLYRGDWETHRGHSPAW